MVDGGGSGTNRRQFFHMHGGGGGTNRRQFFHTVAAVARIGDSFSTRWRGSRRRRKFGENFFFPLLRFSHLTEINLYGIRKMLLKSAFPLSLLRRRPPKKKNTPRAKETDCGINEKPRTTPLFTFYTVFLILKTSHKLYD